MRPLELSQEDISNLTKPAVVRIYYRIEGKVVIPFFDIDWNKLDIVFPGTKKPLELPLDEYLSGSGFIVSRDGYIVTNAHVVSDIFVKRSIAQQFISLRFLAMLESLQQLMKFDATLKSKGINVTDAKQFGEELALELDGKLAEKITLQTTSNKLAVLNPSSSGGKISDLVSKGFPATIVSLNENSFEDKKDVAILKVNATDLPTLGIGDAKIVNTGNTIYALGFPSSGQFNYSDILEPTFTQGTVSAIKDSKTKAFKIFQTDAKVSPGSSGGPLLNEKGEAVGIVTFASGAKEVGDAFAFAIPVDLAKTILSGKNIQVKENDYAKFLTSGILNLQNNRCKKALQNFNVAGKINKNFPVDKYLKTYIDKCNALISSGESIDTAWAEFKAWARNFGNLFWILFVGGIIIFLVIGAVFIKLIRRVKKDEQEIVELEHGPIGMMHAQESWRDEIHPDPIDPALASYIQSARASGMNDAVIDDELRKSGWSEDIIQRAVRK